MEKNGSHEVEGGNEKDSKGTVDHMASSSTQQVSRLRSEQQMQDTLRRANDRTGVSVSSSMNTYHQVLHEANVHGNQW